MFRSEIAMTPDSQHVHVRIVPDDDEDGSGAPSEVPADVTISKIYVVRACLYHMCHPIWVKSVREKDWRSRQCGT